MGADRKMGVGGYIGFDRIGPSVQTMSAYGSYAYQLIINDNNRLSMGISGGIDYLTSDNSDLQTNEIMDPIASDPPCPKT